MQEPIICAQCGTSNPPANKFCGECGSRLPAASASDLPDWIAGTQDQRQPAAQPAANLPAWLQEHDETPEAAPAPVPPTAEPALPSWLADLGVTDEQVEPAASTGDDDLPVWMREPQEGAAPEPSSAQAAPELPAWLLETTEPAQENEDAAGTTTTGALPSWLVADLDQAQPDQAGTAEVETPRSGAAIYDEPSAAPAWLRDDQLSTPEPATDLLPSWLQEAEADDEATRPAQTAGAEPPEPQPAGAISGLPAWLIDVDSGQDESDQAASSTLQFSAAETSPAGAQAQQVDSPAADALPDWLRMDDISTAADGSAVDSVAGGRESTSQGGVELPDWLQQTEDEPASAPERPVGELPDWLANPSEGDQARLDAATRGGGAVESGAGDEALPAWLRDSGGDAGTDLTMDWLNDPGQPSGAAAVSDDLPPWLQAIDSQAADTSAAPGQNRASDGGYEADTHVARIYPDNRNGSAVVEAGAADDGADELPSWLSGLDSPAAPEPSGLPPWLSEPEPAPASPTAEAPEGSGGEFLTSLELPAWLREAEPAAPAAPAADAAPDWLQGLDNDVAVVPAPAPRIAVERPAPAIERSPERLAAMQLLERLVDEPRTEAEPLPADAGRGRTATAFQLLAFLLLLLAILGVLFGPPLSALRLGRAPVEVAATTAQISAVPAGTPVLLAYEWDARRSMELAPLESAVVGALTAQQTPLMLLTTDPQGALLSRRRADLLRARQDNFYNQPGLGFVDLGYEPGGAIALGRLASNFGSAFEQDWAGANLQSQTNVIQAMCRSQTGNVADCRLDRLGMLVVLVDESEDARLWIEQIGSVVPEVPLTFVAPAEAAPLIRPYLTRPNMTLVAGLEDALALQAQGGAVDAQLARRADATAAGGAVFGLLLLLGMIPALWSGRRARRAGRANIWER